MVGMVRSKDVLISAKRRLKAAYFASRQLGSSTR